ncbi:MAG: HDIG domain-containing protein [Planctomycetes bacterium]|nr:HDIG domain-containing protein [Planctomycetota bacterium]MCW8135789.1 HDIG domain-containing protein [Planctomycetota bacterium]
MAFSELQERKLELIEQRLGEHERSQSAIDWSVWTPRVIGAATFTLLMVAVILAPYQNLQPARIGGQVMLVVGFVALYGFYLSRFRVELFNERRKQMFYASSVLLSAAITQAVAVVGAEYAPEMLQSAVTPGVLFGVLLLCGIAYAVVFDQRFAIDALLFTTLANAVVLLSADRFQPIPLSVALAAALTAVLFTRNLRSRYKLALVGVAAGIAAAVILVALWLIGIEQIWATATELTWLKLVFWALGAIIIGAAVGVFSTFLLPVFERVFAITTDLRLIELLEGEHPLISLMQQRAPGTWQHTQNVANFTKRACQAIGANALLGEVGIKFHDLGKMVRPEYFTENEPESKLLHDRLSPMMSALIILSHVSDGVLMARKAKLPLILEDFITGHHGTAVIKYFYYKAKEQAREGETIEEGQFRYPGPKPQRKESAIAAIADQVEATARSRFAGGVSHPDDIRNMVHTAIIDKLLDGQFDECDITIAEWKVVEDSLVKSLASMYHHRVKYPDDPDKDKRKAAMEAREKYRQELAKRRERILTQ